MPSPFLMFTLAGPMAAWGDVAVGESRPTYSRPSKSAVLGLVGAALGLARDDEAAHQSLREGYGFAVWAVCTGRLLLDYHTAQVPTGTSARGLPTRRDEIAEPSLNTTLSSRAYRTDAVAIAALWPRAAPRWTLDTLAEALRRPVYSLYLGRRACPPSLPLRAQVVSADALTDALLAYEARQPSDHPFTPDGERSRVVFSDPDAPGLSMHADTVTRRDDPVHRGRRAFAQRLEVLLELTG